MYYFLTLELDLVMGIIAGTVFWQQGWVTQSLAGILFQNLFFISLGAMMKVPQQFETRSIFYKHQDANFFPTWSYVLGRSLAGLPTALIDGILFGTIVYWFVGMAGPQNGASISNFFIYLLIMIVVSLTAGLVFSIFSSVVKDKPTAQAYMSITVVILVLFSGFTVQPDAIPK
jgi:ABC-type multidrug transport system permease subunit